MDAVLSTITTLDPWALLAIVGVLVFLESAALLGLLVPGELALLAGGAVTATGDVSLVALIAVGVVAATAGEAAGYGVGRRWGARWVARAARRRRLAERLPRAYDLVERRGAPVVFVSRWVGVLRALVPLAAGSLRMPLGRFTVANVTGAVAWVAVVAGVGNLAARSLEGAATWVTWMSVVAGALVVALVVVRRRHERAPDASALRISWPWTLGSIALAVVVYALLLRGTDADLVASARQVGVGLVVAILVLEAGSLLALAQVYRATFRATGGSVDLRGAVRIALGAFGLAQVLPGGGAVGGVYAAERLARRHHADPVTAVSTVVLHGVVTMATLGLLASLVAAGASLLSPAYGRYAVAVAAVTVAVLGLLVLLRRALESPRARRWLAGLVARLTRDREGTFDWDAAIARQVRVLRSPLRLVRPAAWSALNWSLDLAVLALLVAALGVEAPVLAVVTAYAVANLLNGIPLTPGGIGIVETGIAATLVVFGADAASASVAAISYRVLAHWAPLLFAVPIVVSSVRERRSVA